jgi:hypothetical protein
MVRKVAGVSVGAARLAGSTLALYRQPIPTLPLLFTEFMAHTSGSTFQTHLPGSVEPPVWLHDVLRPDGTAFDESEVAVIRRQTATARSARQ